MGGSGQILESLCSLSGIDLHDCHLTTVFKMQPAERVYSLLGPKETAVKGYGPIEPSRYLQAEHAHHLDLLQKEIEAVDPNIIITLGNVPLWAVCRLRGIKKHRGCPVLSFSSGHKVVPTYEPRAIMANAKLKPVAVADFNKARKQSAFPELHRPSRTVYLQPDYDDVLWFYNERVKPAELLSIDIETKGHLITEVGIATSPFEAMVIPFFSRETSDKNYWPSLQMELAVWKIVREIMATKKYFGQNFQYDMQYFWRAAGIPCPGFIGDTMLMHHALQPEMEKGLGFLASIYTEEPSWKFMRADHDTLKKED